MISSYADAEKHVKENLAEIVDLLKLDVELSDLHVMMQVDRSAAGHKAWSFILAGVPDLQHQAVIWLADTGDYFVTVREGLYSVGIEDWLALATAKQDFTATASRSVNYLLALRSRDDSHREMRPFDEIDNDPEHCPVCGKETIKITGIPDHLTHACRECAQRTTDESGVKVRYSNTNMGGDLRVTYEDSGDFYLDEVGSFCQICYIDGSPFEVIENEFGGFIFSPISF